MLFVDVGRHHKESLLRGAGGGEWVPAHLVCGGFALGLRVGWPLLFWVPGTAFGLLAVPLPGWGLWGAQAQVNTQPTTPLPSISFITHISFS